MNLRHQRALAMVRALTAMRPAHPRHVGRLTPQQQPDTIRLAYAQSIEELVCQRARTAFAEVAPEILAELRRLRLRQGQVDAADVEPVDRPTLLPVLAPLVEAVMAFVGAPRDSPPILAQPEEGVVLRPDVRGVFAVYDGARDEIALGAAVLHALARPLTLGVVDSDEDVLAVKVVVHEALHAAARPTNIASTNKRWAAWRTALDVVEEATAEICAQLLTQRFAPLLGAVGPRAAARAGALLFRWDGSEVRLTRPTSYSTWVTRIARLALLARAPLPEWVQGIRGVSCPERIETIARWLACDPQALVAYLALPRGERDDIATAARMLSVDTAPQWTPPWAAAAGDVVEGEAPPEAIATLLAAEASITAPTSSAGDVLAAVDAVDALVDPRASFHARTALQQRVITHGPLLGAVGGVTPSGIRAALVLAFDPLGRLLLGRRRETGRWAIPGGHVERGESPARAAARELEEESNLVPGALELVSQFTNRAGTRVWVFRAAVRGEPTGYYDPDREFSSLRFVDVTAGLPADVAGNLAGPEDPADNVLMQLLAQRHHADDREEELRRARARAGNVGRELEQAQAAGQRARAQEQRSTAAGMTAATREGQRAGRLIDQAAARFAGAFRPRELHAVAREFGRRTSDHQREQLDRQVREAIGVSFSSLEGPIQDGVDEWAAQNVTMVTSISERYFDRLRLDVIDAYAGGTHPETLAHDFADRYDMSLNDARRLARDQIGKLNADVNHERQRQLGVERATWRGMKDNRECDECLGNEGVVFDLATGIDGVLPGYCHPMDRCYSEPDLSGLTGRATDEAAQ